MLYGLTTVLLWSTVATAFKLSLRELRPIELLLVSSLVSILVLSLILIIQKKFHLVFQCSYREYLLSILLGCLNPFLYYFTLFKAYDLLPAQQAQPINYTWAIVLSLLSVPLLKQKIRGTQLLALVVSYCGVVVICTKGHLLDLQFTSLPGVLLALFSTIIWALYWIYNTLDQRNPVVGLFINFICGLPFIICCYLIAGPRLLPLPGILGGIYVGLFEMGICFVLWLNAMKLSSNTAKISNLIFLAPFLSLAFIHIFLGEEIQSSTFAGLGLIIAGLLLQQIRTRD